MTTYEALVVVQEAHRRGLTVVPTVYPRPEPEWTDGERVYTSRQLYAAAMKKGAESEKEAKEDGAGSLQWGRAGNART